MAWRAKSPANLRAFEVLAQLKPPGHVQPKCSYGAACGTGCDCPGTCVGTGAGVCRSICTLGAGCNTAATSCVCPAGSTCDGGKCKVMAVLPAHAYPLIALHSINFGNMVRQNVEGRGGASCMVAHQHLPAFHFSVSGLHSRCLHCTYRRVLCSGTASAMLAPAGDVPDRCGVLRHLYMPRRNEQVRGRHM